LPNSSTWSPPIESAQEQREKDESQTRCPCFPHKRTGNALVQTPGGAKLLPQVAVSPIRMRG
jgi:hypothetical protein